MSAILRASGADFDPDAFCAASSLIVCRLYRLGEPVFPKSRPEGRKNQASGINVVVSRADFREFPRQVEDALAFLEAHRVEVTRLRRFPGVEHACLDFGVARRDVVVQSDYLPNSLLRLAGDLGLSVEVSYYPAGPEELPPEPTDLTIQEHPRRSFAPPGDCHNHDRIVTNAAMSLSSQLKDSPWTCHTRDLRLKVCQAEWSFPDVVVAGDPRTVDENAQRVLIDPLVIIEVLSPSTEALDRGERFHAYRAIPSLLEYVLVSEDPPRFEVYCRRDEEAWNYRCWLPDAQWLTLQSINCVLAFDEVYRGVGDSDVDKAGR